MTTKPLLVLLAVTACTSDHKPPPLGDVVVSRVFHQEIPITVNWNVDVLFVIDNSPAMSTFETKLAGNARELIQLLTPAFGPDLHVGVVTADPADAGRLRQTASVAGSFITTTLQFDTSVLTNVSGPVDDAFVALASVGSAGSTNVQPLAMAQAALAPGANPGFLRDDAALVVVVLTAGDDSSTGTVDSYAAALKALKPDPAQVAVTLASGPCSAGSLSATAAPRLITFVNQFPNRGQQVAICDSSLDGLVTIVFQLLRVSLGSSCIDAPLTSPPDCAVWLEHPMTSEQRVLEPCPASSVPCWSLATDPANCTLAPSLSFHLAPSNYRAVGETVLNIDCVIGSAP